MILQSNEQATAKILWKSARVCVPSTDLQLQISNVKTFKLVFVSKKCNKLTPVLHLALSFSTSVQSFEQDGRSKDRDRGQIQKAASAIIGALSKRHNSTVMLAVVEVKVETQGDSPPVGESRVPNFCLTAQSSNVEN